MHSATASYWDAVSDGEMLDDDGRWRRICDREFMCLMKNPAQIGAVSVLWPKRNAREPGNRTMFAIVTVFASSLCPS